MEAGDIAVLPAGVVQKGVKCSDDYDHLAFYPSRASPLDGAMSMQKRVPPLTGTPTFYEANAK